MTLDDLIEKVRHFAGERDQERLQKAVERTLDLENVRHIRDLTELI